jgi:hypothetical protein
LQGKRLFGVRELRLFSRQLSGLLFDARAILLDARLVWVDCRRG